MKTYEVTITSKNQITLPIEAVRSLKLSQNRVLEMQIKGNTLVLTPEQEILDLVRPFWAKHSSKKPIKDNELKQAARTIGAKQAAK